MSLSVRIASPGLAEAVLRECLSLDSRGVELTVTGKCMEPALREGAIAHVGAPGPSPGIGDVVLVWTSLGLRLHRVVFRYGQTLRTKGDRGIYLDPPVQIPAVLGVWASTETRTQRALRVALSLRRYLAARLRRLSGQALPLVVGE